MESAALSPMEAGDGIALDGAASAAGEGVAGAMSAGWAMATEPAIRETEVSRAVRSLFFKTGSLRLLNTGRRGSDDRANLKNPPARNPVGPVLYTFANVVLVTEKRHLYDKNLTSNAATVTHCTHGKTP